jgi:hypothetical protein
MPKRKSYVSWRGDDLRPTTNELTDNKGLVLIFSVACVTAFDFFINFASDFFRISRGKSYECSEVLNTGVIMKNFLFRYYA